MTESSFELFDIECSDFIRNLRFLCKDSKDPYTREMLEDMIKNVQRYRVVIAETLDIDIG